MKIDWQGFLKKAVEEYPNESCAFLFSKKPYSKKEYWVVVPVKNVSDNPEEEWIPNKKETQLIKKFAIEQGLTKIGNIHTHPYYKEWGDYNEDKMREIIQPSKKDLSFARKFNDIVRVIVCCDDKAIYDTYVHDKFGNKIDIKLVEE